MSKFHPKVTLRGMTGPIPREGNCLEIPDKIMAGNKDFQESAKRKDKRKGKLNTQSVLSSLECDLDWLPSIHPPQNTSSEEIPEVMEVKIQESRKQKDKVRPSLCSLQNDSDWFPRNRPSQNIPEEIEEDVPEEIEEDVPEEIEEDVPEEIEEDFSGKTEDDFSDEIKKEVIGNIKGIQESLKMDNKRPGPSSLQHESLWFPRNRPSQNIPEEIEEDIPEEIEEDIPEEIEEDIPEEFEEDISEDIKEDILEDIKKDVTEEIEEDFYGKTEDDFSDEIMKEVIGNIRGFQESLKMDNKKPGPSSLHHESLWFPRNRSSQNISDEEEIPENIEEEISEEISEQICENRTSVCLKKGSAWGQPEDTSVKEKTAEKENKKETDEEQFPASSSRESCCYSPIERSASERSASERPVSERSASERSASERSASERSDLWEELQEERRLRAALEEDLKMATARKSRYKAALKQEQQQHNALDMSLKKVQAEKNSLFVELNSTKTKVSELKRSQKELQLGRAKLKDKISEMTAEIKKLQKDLKASSADAKSAKGHLIQQQQDNLEKDEIIQSLSINIDSLQSNIESKDEMISSLQDKANQWASDLKEEQNKTCSLQGAYEAALSQQQKDAEDLDHLTHENHKLTSENKRLQGELEAALNGNKQLWDSQGHCSGLEEAVEKEKARFSRAFKKIKAQEKELADKTLALEKSLMAEELLRSSLKSEKARVDQMLLARQTAVDPTAILSNQLREASAASECHMYNMQTLRTENADIRAKFHNMERDYERIRAKKHCLTERHKEMVSKVSESQLTITKLQYMVDGFQEQLSESKTRREELEDTLKQEKTRNSELQLKVDQLTSVVAKEKSGCERYHVELKEALTKQIEILEEKHRLSIELQKAQDNLSRLHEQLADSNSQSRHLSDVHLLLNQQKSVDDKTQALSNLQQDYADLGKRHSNIHSNYSELLKTHCALQVKYERLCGVRGDPRPDFGPPPFTV